MTMQQIIHTRYSVRSYSTRPVEDEKIALLLETARLAPTAANRQPFRIVVVRAQEKLERLAGLCRFRHSPLVFVLCGVPAEAWVRASDHFNACLVDTSIVCDHLMLAATELGLGSLWMSSFDVKGVAAALELPEGVEPHHLLCLGYAEGEAPGPGRFATARKPLENLVSGDWSFTAASVPARS